MEFPVDILARLSHDDLEHSAEEYMSDLLYSNPDKAEYFSLPNSRRVPLSISNVGFVPIYGCDLRHKVLALFSPEDQFTAVALYLADQWWALEDILKTADPSRKGILKVRSLGERIVLYVLNRIVYRSKEMSKNEVPFLCHSASDYAKILWRNGEAIGFYSVKPSGSLCNSFVTQRYLLPVMDSIYVKKIHRGNGYGLQMLEDFVDSFKEDSLGLKYPISPAMLKVCEQYLNTYPADQELLWEVESVGGPFQRSRVASRLQSIVVSGGVLFHENDVAMDEEMQKETTLTTVEVTEVTVVKNHLRVDTEDTPVSTRTRSSNYRKRIRGTELTEEILPDKITRVDDSAQVTLENSEEEAPEEEGKLAPADDENKGEEQPGLIAAEDGDQEEPSPVSEEAVGPVASESQGQQEDNQTLDVELLEKLDAGQINGEITDDTGEEEGESSDPAAMEENCTQAGEESQPDEEIREAVEDTSESQDTGGTVPEEPEEQTPVVEEALSEEEPPLSVDQQTTSVEEPSPAAEEQTSEVEEINVDKQATAGEASSPEDQPSPTEEENHLEEEELQLVMEEDPAEEAMAVEEPSAAGEAQAEGQDSSVNEDTAADPGQDTVDHPKVPELEEPASEVTDETAIVS
ncbi:hypothetical protein GJAV_G00045750 [Gymnothorax javanicus]|nr:hypothetical protein GJAV_G00045750 [Gymnothorax javanicus]